MAAQGQLLLQTGQSDSGLPCCDCVVLLSRLWARTLCVTASKVCHEALGATAAGLGPSGTTCPLHLSGMPLHGDLSRVWYSSVPMAAGASRPAGLYESPAPWGQPPAFQPTPTAMSMDITLGGDQTGPARRSQAGGSQEDTDGFRAFGYTGEANKRACLSPVPACARVTHLHALC